MKKEIKLNKRIVLQLAISLLASFCLVLVINLFGRFDDRNLNYIWSGNTGKPDHYNPAYVWYFVSPIENNIIDNKLPDHAFDIKGSASKDFDVNFGYQVVEMNFFEKLFVWIMASVQQFKYWTIGGFLIALFFIIKDRVKIQLT